MRHALAIIIGFTSLVSSPVNNGQPAKKDTLMKTIAANKGGWIALFDGKTLAGWHSYGKAGAEGDWTVADGAIYLDSAHKTASKGHGGGDLVTNEEYDNFDFKYDWKISAKGNSGLIFYINEDAAKYPNTYNTGLEMQVLDNDGHPDAKIHKHRAGDLYDLIASSKETVKPAGEWNHAEIISNKGKLQLFLNGTKVVETTLWDDAWKQLVAGSKFKSMPGFGTFSKGKISLQDHGNAVWYKNIKIKKL